MQKLKLDLSKNNVICGDCKDWLPYIPDNSIDLIYIDPPFFSNREYQIIWGNGFEYRSFDSRWKGGIKHYICWMRERLSMAHRILKETGTIYLHCDLNSNHYLKILMDELFGVKNFKSEIIWYRYNKIDDKRKIWTKFHDNILCYSKTKNIKWNIQTRGTGEMVKRKKIKKIGGKIANINEMVIYEKQKSLNRSVIDDVYDITMGNSKEKIGYKTQKPEALLNRLISRSSNKGDIVLDFFGGGGTAAKVAYDLKRRFITGDVSPVAVRVIKERLKCHFIDCNPYLTKDEWKSKNGHIFAEKVCEYMGWNINNKKTGDGGIDGWANNNKTWPVQIKNSKVGEPDVRDFAGALNCQGYKGGTIIGWHFSKNCYEAKARLSQTSGIKIELRDATTIVKPIGSMEKKQWEKLYRERVKKAQKWPPAA